jgi:transcriptional regulator GlxA family with amidase domain
MLYAVSEVHGLIVPPLRTPRRHQLIEVVRHIEEHYAERIVLEDLALLAGLSIHRFVTVFRREIGISPHRYICLVRVRAARALLRDGVAPAIVAIEVGFFDQSHFCRHFRAVCRITPGQFLASLDTRKAVV